MIEYSQRPFHSVSEMDETLIERWNNVVKKEDTVYHLGDIFLHKDVEKALAIRQRLKGHICLVKGNHEKTALRMKDHFVWIKDYAEIKVPDAEEGEQRIVLCHYAFRVWNKSHHGSWHLYGHSHGSLPDDPNAFAFDVGVDCHDYSPISLDRVREIMAGKRCLLFDPPSGRQ